MTSSITIWNVLKEFQFEDRTVRIMRSTCALRKWRVETNYRDGRHDHDEVVEREDIAWGYFCCECHMAVKAMEERHTFFDSHPQEVTR